MTEVKLAGSCLCGSIAYEIEGDVLQFNHCHCERCRKSSGTGHASNIILKLTSLKWTAGEDLLKLYTLPEAKRFANNFCRECGSCMPRVTPDGSIAVVPAGTLDNDPGVRPERRIFQGSRADWSCAAEDLPSFERYQPRD
jgi:hypothetical protein